MIAGKYRVERVVGRGAMGVVVMATHVELGQHVALKILSERTPSSGRLARLRREARAAAAIRSEHVARVLDVGTLPDGDPFIVMEHLEGTDLRVAIEEHGPFSIRDAADRIIEACEALAEAHAQGIFHRDLKPSNLFMALRADGSVILKVIDFGISTPPSIAADEPRLTAASALVGSPHYMSPEQIRSPLNVDARTDVWSLGVVLYELLTGKRPFEDQDQRKLLACISTEEPRAIRTLRPDVPEELEAIVHHCLKKDAVHRVSTVEELARLLKPFAGPSAAMLVERITRLLKPKALSVPVEDDSPPAPPTLADSASGDKPSDSRIGEIIAGRFRLEKRLGEGAMGVVYEAIDEASGKRVAVKLIDRAADANARARLKREAHVASTLVGEHIVRVLETGSSEADASPFIVMELLHGRDLDREIRRTGALDQPTVIKLFIQACEGLAEVHARSLVHRDIKPSNLFLHEGADGQIVVKICDFGIVKSVETDVDDPEARGITRTGFVLGSPAYMSPEQARNPSEVDARSDIFSLCIAMYEALSGKNPWTHYTRPTELIVALWTESVSPIREAVPAINPKLAAIVHRGIERDPEKRFSGAAELGAALRELSAAQSRRSLVTWIVTGAIVAIVVFGLSSRFIKIPRPTLLTTPITPVSAALVPVTESPPVQSAGVAPEPAVIVSAPSKHHDGAERSGPVKIPVKKHPSQPRSLTSPTVAPVVSSSPTMEFQPF